MQNFQDAKNFAMNGGVSNPTKKFLAKFFSMKKIIFIVVLAFLLASCATSSEKVKVGIILPLTGGQSYAGENLLNGYNLALEDSSHIEIIIEDSRSDPKGALTAFKKLTELDDVKIIVGPVLSSNLLTVAPLANEQKVIILGPTSSAEKVTEAGDYVFRVRETGKIHGRKIAELVEVNNWTVALMPVNQESGLTYTDVFKELFKGEILVYEAYEKDEQDVRTHIAKIKATAPDAVYITGFAEDIGRIVKLMREQGVKAQLLSTVGMEDQTFLDIAGEAAEGIIYTSPFDKGMESAKEFQVRFNEKHGNDADTFLIVNAYDSLVLIDKMVGICGEDTGCIKSELYKTKDYRGVSGTFSFDENGDVDRELFLKTVKNGEFVVLE